jgi:Protein of unknown function (DUF2591)
MGTSPKGSNMKIKTSELTRHALDWAVCVAAGWAPTVRSKVECQNELTTPVFLGDQEQRPSTNWAQGGPIINTLEYLQQYRWGGNPQEEMFCAVLPTKEEEGTRYKVWFGPTPLIAAMRCYVASKLGDEVEIPEELV